MNARDQKEDKLTLDLLDAIQERDDISQRHLAEQMGVALGLANAYLKRCVKKGLIKINNAPANRYLYYLTPKGFSEKARLTAEFLSTSLALVREARSDYNELFKRLAAEDRSNIMLAGISDLTEIAYLRALEQGVKLNCVWQPNAETSQFFSSKVIDDEAQLEKMITEGLLDVAVITSMEQTSELVSTLANYLPSDRVVLPDFLNDLTYRVESNNEQLI
jgi:DNA-binding MarR family transcriptional regulator